MEVGQDCFCGDHRICAVLVALCMCHAHRLGWVNIQNHTGTSDGPESLQIKTQQEMMRMCMFALFQIWKHPGPLL